MMKLFTFTALLVLSLIAITGCASQQATPVRTPTRASIQAATPTAPPRPTATIRSTATTRPAPTSTATPVRTPTPAPSPTPVPPDAPNIIVSSPAAGAKISSPVRVTGTARVFEAVVQVEIKDAEGKVIGKATTLASIGAPERGNYSVDVSFTPPAKEQPGTVNVFSRSPRDGSVINLVTVLVILTPATPKT